MWGVYTLFIGTLLTIGILSVTEDWGMTNMTYRVLSVIVFFLLLFAVSFLCYSMCGQHLGRKGSKSPDLTALEAIAAAVVFLFLLAFGIKRLLLSLTTEGILLTGDGQWFHMAAVTQDDAAIPWMPHGATYLFTVMLRGMCLMFGNIEMSLILLQVLLQFAAAVLLYFAVRRLLGRLAAFITAAGITFLPVFADSTRNQTAELLLLLVTAAALSALSGLLRLTAKAGMKRFVWKALFLLYGVLMAGCIYLDAIGVVLLLVSIAAVLLVTDSEPTEESGRKALMRNRIIQILFIGIGAVLGAAGICLLRADYMHMTEIEPFWEYCNIYIENFRETAGFTAFIQSIKVPYNVPVFLLAAFGITGFWFVRRDKFCITALYFAGTCLLRFVPHDGISYHDTANLGILLLAALALQTMADYREQRAAERDAKTANAKTANAEADNAVADGKTADEGPEEDKAKPRLLENPLPLPKKHVPKTMDYRIEVKDSDYDIAVDDTDDYDIF